MIHDYPYKPEQGAVRSLGIACILLSVLLGISPCFGKGTPPKIAGIEVRIQGNLPDAEAYKAIARNLIQFKVKDPYTPELMEQAAERLIESNVFSRIHIPDPRFSPAGPEVVFELTPFGRVKDIRISGAFPLFNREIMNIMTLYTGDGFSQEKLDEQIPRIARLYEREGFMSPQIRARAEKDPSDGNYIIFIRIEKGGYLKVRKVEFTGNNHISSARLRLMLKTWKSSLLGGSARRFVEKDMQTDLKTLISFYREKGFAEVRVKPEIRKNQDLVNLVLHIEEGPRYRVEFNGNNNIWAYTLKKDITLAREGNRNNTGLRKSLRKIRRTYNEKGYQDVLVTHNLRERGDEALVTIEIDEGGQYRVGSVNISGNKSLGLDQLQKVMLTTEPGFLDRGIYVARHLENDINAIRALYLKEGFASARVEKTVKIRPSSGKETGPLVADIRLLVHEGLRTLVGRVTFSGLSALSPAEAEDFISQKPGMPFRLYMLETDERAVQMAVSEQGYPRAKVNVSTTRTLDSKTVGLNFKVDQGGFVSVGEVFYMGNFRTRSGVLDRELELKTGDPLSLKKLLASRRNLLNLTALDSARIRTVGLETENPEVDLIIELEEKKPYYFETGLGYDTERHLFLNSRIGDKNLMGKNMDLNLEGEISQIGYKAALSLISPRFLGRRITSRTGITAENQEAFNKDYGTRTLSASQKLFRPFYSDRLVANLGLSYESREQYPIRDRAVTQSETFTTRHVLVLTPGLVLKTIDSHIRPTRGQLATLGADLSSGIDNNLDDFIKYSLDLRTYHSLSENLVLAFRGGYGFIQPYGGNTRVPEDQLFFLGGTASVRGFGENLVRRDEDNLAVGGREMILGSAELRLDLGLNLELTGFYDTGAVRRAQVAGGSDGFRSSAGTGLRYMTPVGPISLVYGWKLNPEPGESPGSFHFSMGYTF